MNYRLSKIWRTRRNIVHKVCTHLARRRSTMNPLNPDCLHRVSSSSLIYTEMLLFLLSETKREHVVML